jgi:signal transduction histidine kinase
LEAAEVTLPRGRSVRSRGMIARAKLRLIGLAELVDDLIWLSQSKSMNPPYRKEKISPFSMAQRAVQEVVEKARKKGIRIGVSGSTKARINADPRAFLRVLSNLLDNAVKYTPAKKGDISLQIEDMGDWLVVTVSDSGIGIPEEEQSGLFQEFMRGSNARSTREPGTGLGLTIVKRILDWHGGKVKMVSKRDGGTRVETWWPPASINETRRGAS